MTESFESTIADLLGTGVHDKRADSSVSYDGASVLSQEMQGWLPALRSADADILPNMDALDARSRDILRNDAYVAGGSTILKDSIVGSQYVLNCRPATKLLWGKDDEVWETEFQEEVETKFHLWADSPQHWVDAARRLDFTSMVRLAVGVFLAGGEVVSSAEWIRETIKPFNTSIQMIDKDRLSTPTDRQFDKNIRNGVEVNRYGAPQAYYIRHAHPSDWYFSNDPQPALMWKRVPAYKPWGRPLILHIVDQLRPDQTRGISAMVTALTEMKMTRAFRKTELQRAVVSATYAASIESDFPSAVYESMGTGSGGSDNPYVSWMEDYLEAVYGLAGGAKNLTIEGSRIPIFAPGTHLKIQNPGATGPVGSQFEQSLLRHIASAIGVSYEELSKDYSQTSYSSARAALSNTSRAMRSKKKLVADGIANFVYRLWFEEAMNNGHLETLRRRRTPNFYEGLNAEAYLGAEWIGAEQTSIDPLKETQADVLALKNGLDTKEAVIARRKGSDWRNVQRQIKRELEADRALGLPSVYEQDSKDMVNSISGTEREGRDETQ